MTSPARFALASGDKYPYAPYGGPYTEPPWQRRAANGVLAELRGRGGVDVLDDLDDDIRAEIVDVLEEIIRLAHAEAA